MRDARRDDVAGRQTAQPHSAAFLLRGTARKQCGCRACFILEKALNQKAYRAVYTGNYRDITRGSLTDSNSALFTWNQSFHAAEIHDKIVCTVAQQGARLQNAALAPGCLQSGGALQCRTIFRRIDLPALRIIGIHLTALLFSSVYLYAQEKRGMTKILPCFACIRTGCVLQ